jgi:hypothetical protein
MVAGILTTGSGRAAGSGGYRSLTSAITIDAMHAATRSAMLICQLRGMGEA